MWHYRETLHFNMRRFRIKPNKAILLVLALLAACSSTSSSLDDNETTSSPTPSGVETTDLTTTSTSSTIPTSPLSTDIRITSTGELAPPTNCQIPSSSNQRENLYLVMSAGFPRPVSPETFQSANILVIPISTADFSFSDEDLAFAEIGVQKAFEFWTSVSYGQAELDYAVLPKKHWPQLPQVASELGFPRRTNTSDFAELANVAFDLVKASFDVSPFDNFFFALPKDSLFLSGQGIKLRNSTLSKNGIEQTGTMVGGEYLQLWEITAHELGHSWLRLWDLYKFDTLEKFMGIWEIMGGSFDAGKEPTAWSRWLSGWIADGQIRCIDNTGDSFHFIEAIENASTLPKATVIRKSQTSVVVIESRRNLGYDTAGPATIVYTVDSEKSAMEGVYRLNATLTSVGQTAKVGSLTVTLLESDEWGDLVQVTKDS